SNIIPYKVSPGRPRCGNRSRVAWERRGAPGRRHRPRARSRAEGAAGFRRAGTSPLPADKGTALARATRGHGSSLTPRRVVGSFPLNLVAAHRRGGRVQISTQGSLPTERANPNARSFVELLAAVPGGKPAMRPERPVPSAGLFRMETSTRKYEEFAAEC